MKKLSIQFYERTDVLMIARDLIGRILVSDFQHSVTAGRIVETEAYVGLTDSASHSFAGKRTHRNEHMYAAAGTAYVYICYGMHHLFNVVTNAIDIPDAVLIRAVEPLQGMGFMAKRTGKAATDNSLTRGPGNLSKAMGISKLNSGTNLLKNEIYIADDEITIAQKDIGVSMRIGVENSGDDALKPFRFYVKGNKFVSGYPNR